MNPDTPPRLRPLILSAPRLIALRPTQLTAVAILVLVLGVPGLHAQAPRVSTETIDVDGSATRLVRAAAADTVHVAAPTGHTDTDGASILAALDEAQPGGTIQFAPGTYLVGEVIRVETPRITLMGHAEGTTLRGCNLDEYEQAERDFVTATAAREAAASRKAASRCGMLELTGGDVTVRGLTFEYSRMGLILGCCQFEFVFRNTEGGYLIEDNTFRSSLNGIRPFTTERSVIRGNRFVNTFHAISGAGSFLHVLDNEISAPQPEQVPVIGHPSFALALGPLPRRAAQSMGIDANGEGNVIAGNRIEGHPDGIYITVPPGTSFRNNIIRDNTIIVERVPIPSSGARPYIVDVTDESDSTIVGIPLALYSVGGPPGSPDVEAEEGTFEDNLIEANQLIGAEGVAIAVHRGSRNRIVGNTITGIRRREPFPGNTVLSSSEWWREANGSGIWLSPGSDGNEIVRNTFDDIAGHVVVVEGDSNHVELESASDSVRDLGSGNRVTVRANETERAVTPDAAHLRRVPANPDSAIVFGVADEFFAEYAARAANLDYPGAQHDRLPDNSLAGLRRWQEREDEWLSRLDAVDSDALGGSAAWALYVSLRERLEASVQFRVCRRPLWNVDPDWGWHIDYKLPDLARSQPVGTPAARAAALRRWSGFGRFVDTEIDNLRQGMREGYVAPRAFVEEVIEQVGRLAGQAPESSTFYDPARRDTTPEFREAFGRILSDEILPALRRYQQFLSQEYLPRARSDVALTSMPDGLECYRAFLRRTTGLPLDETQVDSIGQALLPRVLAERDSVARTRYGLSDGRALSEAIAGDSALMWASHGEALAAARSAVARAADLLPRYFSRLPPIPPLVVDTMTTEDALNATYGAYYAGIPADAAQLARVVVNPVIFDDPGNRGALGPLAYHEGLPGHHLQAAFDRAFGPSHPYARYADDDGMAGIAGFVEGWATYAHHFLAPEMGLLSDAEMLVRNDYEISQLGWFVITDGIHMRGWSQDQVRDTWQLYLAGWDDDVLNDTWMVAAATPGYTLNYLLGALEIQRLRTLAERELGTSFDLREFHDQVLRYGDIPLGALREVVQRWIRETLRRSGTLPEARARQAHR